MPQPYSYSTENSEEPMWVAQITGIAILTTLIWYDPSTVAFPER